MEEERQVSVNIRFPEDVHRQLQELAHEQRRSLNKTVVVAVERYIRQTRARPGGVPPRQEAPDGR
jgi:predicted HicB family RNase H-like nuclease